MSCRGRPSPFRPALCLVAVVLAGCAGGGSGTGGGGTGGATGGASAPASPFAVPNPYATANATDVEDVRIGRAVVFGDSYSAPGLWPFRNWAEQLVDDGLFATQANFAVGGAVTRGTDGRSMAAQIDAWHASGAPFRDGDLTLVYFGHNDVKGTPAQRTQSKQALDGHLDTLAGEGATAASRRLFLMLIHDWSRNPDPGGVTRATVLDWNGHLVDEANARERVVAVDVFTLFERIFADPGRFGFTNVTTVDAANSDSTALFYDGQHFGEAGNRWIARLVRHYLTRGWDWANTLSAGSQAANRLEQDIDRGLLLAVDGRGAPMPDGLFAFTVGATGTVPDGSPGFATETAASSGFGTGFAMPDGSSFAVAFASGRSGFDVRDADGSESGAVDSRAVGLVYRTRVGPFTAHSRFLWSRQQHERRVHDSALDTVASARTGGEVLRLSQSLALPFEAFGLSLQPAVDLGFERQGIDAYSLSDPYLGKVAFGAAEADSVLLGIGLDAAAPPVALGGLGTLSLGVSARLERSLWREDWQLPLAEGLTRRVETVERPAVDRLGLTFDAGLALADDAALALDVAAVRDATTDDSAAVFLRYRRTLGAAGRRPGVLPATTTR